MERYVLFLDILGFSDLIENNSSDEVEKIFKNNFVETASMSIHMASMYFGIQYNGNMVLDGNIFKDLIQDVFNIHIMSDSIIVWTNDLSEKSLCELCGFASVYVSMAFILGVPLRGGISKGAVSFINTNINNINQSCLVGKGIINAYKIEKKQKWMGVTVDSDCFECVNQHRLNLILSIHNSFIKKYNVPLKDGCTSSEYVIDWTLVDRGIIKNDFDFFKESFSRFNKSIDRDDVVKKIENTFCFYQEMIKIKAKT